MESHQWEVENSQSFLMGPEAVPSVSHHMRAGRGSTRPLYFPDGRRGLSQGHEKGGLHVSAVQLSTMMFTCIRETHVAGLNRILSSCSSSRFFFISLQKYTKGISWCVAHLK